MKLSVLARSLARRVLGPCQEAINKRKVSGVGSSSCGKVLKTEDALSEALLPSKIQNKINEQNLRIANLTNEKNLILQKLEREVSFFKLSQDTQVERIRILGNAMLFKYLKHSVKFVGFGAAFSSLLIMHILEPSLKDSFQKVLRLTTGEASSSSDNNEKGQAGKNFPSAQLPENNVKK